jgi:transposase
MGHSTSTRRTGSYVYNRSCFETSRMDFLGFFSGLAGKSPGVFWKKDWGTITLESYCQHIVPVIDGWIRLMAREEHVFMQDNAKPHSAANTLAKLEEQGIRCIQWPPYSPNLNPIEHVWKTIKQWIQQHYPEKMTYDRLRKVIREAWEKAITEEYLNDLLDTMQKRYEDVYLAAGKHSHW